MTIAPLAKSPILTAASRGPAAPAAGDGFRAGSAEGWVGQMQQLRALAQNAPKSELQSRLDRLFAASQTSPNPVIKSLQPAIANAEHIKINLAKIDEWADKLQPGNVKPANWHFPCHIDEDTPRTIDFFCLMNSINFMFFDPNSGEKFSTEWNGQKFSGAEGMVVSLKRAMAEGVPILDADFLANVSEDQMRHIFRGNMEMPLLKERTEIFHEVGQVLKDKYQGHFYNLAKDANFRAFDNGNGMVERLTHDFPSFRDRSGDLVFNKRAQLAVGMLASRLEGTGLFDCPDVDKLTVFADYELPRGLRSMGILEYDNALADTVDQGRQIPKDSKMETEIRAFTIVASELLKDDLQKKFPVDARGIDSALWYGARNDKTSKHHLTITTAY